MHLASREAGKMSSNMTIFHILCWLLGEGLCFLLEERRVDWILSNNNGSPLYVFNIYTKLSHCVYPLVSKLFYIVLHFWNLSLLLHIHFSGFNNCISPIMCINYTLSFLCWWMLRYKNVPNNTLFSNRVLDQLIINFIMKKITLIQ